MQKDLLYKHKGLTFAKFIWSLGTPYLWIVLIALPLQLIIFKMQYPFPNFRGDSESYIVAAILHAGATEWPVGYSIFLRLIHFFSHSDTFFITIQYLFLELSALLFLFTLQYFIQPGRAVFITLFVFIVFNPLFLHLGNYIMSDALFISLSLFWISQLIWIIYRPSSLQIIGHALILFCLFTVRYNALFYPLVSLLVLILSSLRWPVKIAGIVLSMILIGLFVIYTENKFYQLNKVRQFAPFSGWQLANNALYTYRNIQLKGTDKVPARFQELDSFIRQSFIAEKKAGLVLNVFIKDYYIWDGGSPLAHYLKYRWRGDTVTDMFSKWTSMGPIYSAYGSYLIREYPREYFEYFVWPNVSNFFFPSIADLGYYNQGNHQIANGEAMWFGYKRLEISHASKDFELTVLKPYPYFIALVNITFLFSILLYLLFNEFRMETKAFNQMILLMAGFWLLNFCFSTSASSIELRYQVFQLLLNLSCLLILIEWLIRAAFSPKPGGKAPSARNNA